MSQTKKLGLREIRALLPGESMWETTTPGFGARRQKGVAVAYVLIYRALGGRQRFFTIGRHGAPWTPETARDEARRLLGEVARGGDPAADKKSKRKAALVSQLCDLYMADVVAGRVLTGRKKEKKPSTIATDRNRIDRHIKPMLGRLSVESVTSNDIDDFLHAVASGKTATGPQSRGGKGTASRTVGLLGAIFSYAVRHRMRTDNPCRGVAKFADGSRERRLNDDEYAALGQALRAARSTNVWPFAIEACLFLTLTGWRRGEALELRWKEVDLARRTARLGDTKTGLSVRPLSHEACDLLRRLDRVGGRVFPASRGDDARMTGFPAIWARIMKLGDLPPDVTPHVLRHSFASLAGDLGYSEPTIAALVGHKGRSVTSRYVHAADTVLLAAADAVAARTAVLLGHNPECVVVSMPSRITAV